MKKKEEKPKPFRKCFNCNQLKFYYNALYIRDPLLGEMTFCIQKCYDDYVDRVLNKKKKYVPYKSNSIIKGKKHRRVDL